MAKATEQITDGFPEWLDDFSRWAISEAKGALKQMFSNCPWTEVRIPLDPDMEDKYRDYQFETVGINQHNFTVQRGIPVPVPVPIYMILKESGRIPLMD